MGYLSKLLKMGFGDVTTGVIDPVCRHDALDAEMLIRFDYNVTSDFEYEGLGSGITKIRSVASQYRKFGWRFLCSHLLRFKWRKLREDCAQAHQESVRTEHLRNLFNTFNPTHVHFQYLSFRNLEWMKFVNPRHHVILTFWGSDLMTTQGGLKEYKAQRDALQRANKITLQTLDHQIILLSKFGQELKEKVKCVTFNPMLKRRREALRFDNDKLRSWVVDKYGIVDDQICIKLGYSAAVGQNHIPVLNVLKELPKSVREQLTVFIPLSYGGKKAYIEEVEAHAHETGLNIKIIREFLPDDEMLEITRMCEILICVREHDALNAAMIESLYAGKFVITGSWLPY